MTGNFTTDAPGGSLDIRSDYEFHVRAGRGRQRDVVGKPVQTEGAHHAERMGSSVTWRIDDRESGECSDSPAISYGQRANLTRNVSGNLGSISLLKQLQRSEIHSFELLHSALTAHRS